MIATCATLAAIIASAAPGSVTRYSGECANLRISTYTMPPRIIEATGSTVHGIRFDSSGGGVTWNGGTIRAPGGGEASGPAGYGVNVYGRDVTFDRVRFTNANRAVVGNGAVRLTVRRSLFELWQDGIIASGGTDLDVTDNTFIVAFFKPTKCTVVGASTVVTEGLSRSVCVARSGTWADGYHQDAGQVFAGVKRFRFARNFVWGAQQAFGQMDSVGDAGPEDGIIEDNTIAVTGYHSITFAANALRMKITGNRLHQLTGQRTIIRFPSDAVLCGNVVQRVGDPGAAPCPAP